MLQAMARGRSVVSTDVAGARDVLSAGAGGIVPVESAAALADALAERLLDPGLAAAEGEVGRRIAVERYDVSGRVQTVRRPLPKRARPPGGRGPFVDGFVLVRATAPCPPTL